MSRSHALAEDEPPVSMLLEAMDSEIRLRMGELATLEVLIRRGDKAAYRTYKIRKRALHDLQKQLRKLERREYKRRFRES